MDPMRLCHAVAEPRGKMGVMSSMLTSGVAVQDVGQQLSSSWWRLRALLFQHLPQKLFEGLDDILVCVCTMIENCC